MAARRKSPSKTAAARGTAMVRAPAAPTSIVVRAPAAPARRSPSRRRSPPRAGGAARGGGLIPADTTASLAAGGVIGLAKSTGLLDKLPRLPVVGRIGALGILAHLYARHTGSRLAADVSKSCATLAAFQLASSDKPLSERIDGGDDSDVIDVG